MKSISIAVAFFTSLVVASPLAAPLVARDCPSIPSEADDNVLKQVYNIARNRGVSDKVMLATFETAWVESHVHNLPYVPILIDVERVAYRYLTAVK